MNPYVLIATHQRVEITTKNIDCILQCGVNVILVVSDTSERRIFTEKFPGIEIVLHPNYPLGAKWQAGVHRAHQLSADPLIINGSDDILSPQFFEEVYHWLAKGMHFVGLKSWYVYDLKRVYKFDYQARIPLGGGRAYSKAFLEKIRYKLFESAKEKHLDDQGYRQVINSGMENKILEEPLILSVKGHWRVMNPLNAMFRSRNVMLRETIYEPVKILKDFNYVRD